jgi:hypothetical protein
VRVRILAARCGGGGAAAAGGVLLLLLAGRHLLLVPLLWRRLCIVGAPERGVSLAARRDRAVKRANLSSALASRTLTFDLT